MATSAYGSNTELFKKAYDEYAGLIYRICYSFLRTKHDAEDAVQETFIRLYRFAPSFESEVHMRNWLSKVSSNICKNMLKKNKHKNVEYKDYLENEPAAEPDEAYTDTMEAVMSLGEKYRVIILLHYSQGYKINEISEMLGISVSAVKMRLKTARDKLKLELTE